MHAGGDGRVGVWWGGWGPSETDTQKNCGLYGCIPSICDNTTKFHFQKTSKFYTTAALLDLVY